MKERRAVDRRKVTKFRAVITQSQLIAYVLIVLVAIIGFFTIQRNADDQNNRDRRSRAILCNAIQQQSGGSEIVVDRIVALVVDNPPPPGSPQEFVDRYNKSVVIMRKFSKDTKKVLPTLDCSRIIIGEETAPPKPTPTTKGQP
jgi:hypothetical protein